MAEAINAALVEAMELRPETILLGEDVGITGGVFRITEGLQERFGEDRVIDTPLERIRHRRDGHRHGDCGLRGRSRRSSSTDSSIQRSTRSSATWVGFDTGPGECQPPDRGQVPERRRNRSPRASLRFTGGVLRSRSGVGGGLPVEPDRCQGPARRRSGRRRPGDLPRAESYLPIGSRRCPDLPLHDSYRSGSGRAGRKRSSQSLRTGEWFRSRSRRPSRPLNLSRSSISGPCSPGTGRPSWTSVEKTGRLVVVQEAQGRPA